MTETIPQQEPNFWYTKVDGLVFRCDSRPKIMGADLIIDERSMEHATRCLAGELWNSERNRIDLAVAIERAVEVWFRDHEGTDPEDDYD